MRLNGRSNHKQRLIDSESMTMENPVRVGKRKRSNTSMSSASKKQRGHREIKGPHGHRERRPDVSGRKASNPRLPRPKRATTFTLPSHLIQPAQAASLIKPNQSSRSPTPKSANKAEPLLTRLTRVSIILNALHRRNRNQHRNQPFYKHLDLLRRCIARLQSLYQQPGDGGDGGDGHAARGSTTSFSAEQARQRFERESRLRSQREVHEEWIRETIVPGAYVAFTGLITDTQFAQLGIVLLGVLADVASIVGLMRNVDTRGGNKGKPQAWDGMVVGLQKGSGTELVGLSTLVTGPDRGEIVKRIYAGREGREIVEEIIPSDKVVYGKGDVGMDLGETIDRNAHELAKKTLSSVSSPSATAERTRETNVSASESNEKDTKTIDEEGDEQAIVSDLTTTTFVKNEHSLMPQPSHHHPFSIEDGNDNDFDFNSPQIPAKPSQRSSQKATPTASLISSSSSPPPLPASHPSSSTTKTTSTNKPPPKTTSKKKNDLESIIPRETATAAIVTATTKQDIKNDKKKKKKKTKNAIDDLFSGFT